MQKLPPLELIGSEEREMEIIENHIKKKSTPGEILQILEAGCGRRWGLRLEGVEYFLTGVDLDKSALEVRKDILNDLDEIVEGDLRLIELREGHFDVIYNSFVLEHVKGAELVLSNFVRWIKPGGLIIVRIPDPNSVHGFVTRISPHWFHIRFYRALGFRNAGRPGFWPYPVHYDPVVSRKGIRDFCSRKHVNILGEYADGYMRPGTGVVRLLLHSVKLLVSALSFGLLSARHTNLMYVLQQQAINSAGPLRPAG